MVQPQNDNEVTAFSPLEERNAVQASILEKIAASDSKITICSWKRSYNKFSLISRLPPELLMAVFYAVRNGSVRIRWIREVSHICSYWRDIALESPSLWSEISFKSLPWALEMLVRSKMSPLTVKVLSEDYRGSEQDMFESVVQALLLQTCRIKSFSFGPSFGRCDEEFAPLLTFLQSPTPLLEYCSISIPWRLVNVLDLIPDNIFPYSPLLEDLRLETSVFNGWACLSLANLQKLNIYTSVSTVSPVLLALSTMPLLESVHLNLFIEREFDDKRHTIVASLPHLQELTLECSLPELISLITHIDFPGTTCMTLRPSADDDVTEISQSLRNLSEILGRKVLCFFRILRIETVRIMLGSPAVYHGRGDVFRVPDFKPQLSLFIPEGDSSDFLFDILQPLRLDRLEMLDVITPHIGTTAFYKTLFGDLPRLRRIRIFRSEAFLSALSPDAQSVFEHPGQVPYTNFKALRLLAIYVPTWQSLLVQRDWLPDFVAWSKAKREQGAGLKYLALGYQEPNLAVSVKELEDVADEVKLGRQWYHD